MSMQERQTHTRGLCIFLCALASLAAQAESAKMSITVGADYSSGYYGDAVETRTWAYPFVFKYEQERMTYKVSLPWVHTTGPSNVVGTGADRVVTVSTGGRTRTENGWGDLVAAATYALYENREGRYGIDITGKAKLATGDKEKGLSTGKNDYALLLDGYKTYGTLTALATVGWKKMGDPNGIDYHDPWLASLGFSHALASQTSWGAMYDWREKLTDRGAPVREVMLFLAHRFTPGLKLQAYLVHGYSDASPDHGLGVTLNSSF